MVRHRIILTGGGTGGHIYPALAVSELLKEDPTVEAILYIGALGHLEEKLAAQKGIDFLGLNVSGMPRRLSAKTPAWPFKMFSAIARARRALKEFGPTAVLGTGGYAAAPPLAAALIAGIPYAIHEPDAHPGLVNRTFAGAARLVSLGMEGARDRLHTAKGQVVVNGNPVGKNFVQPLSRNAASAILGVKPDYPTLLVTGGSQGAIAINDTILKALPALLALEPPIQVVHQVGDKNFADYKGKIDLAVIQTGRYEIRPYFDDLALAYAVSDLTVCRAGAMTISELAVMGVPAIFVPYPHAAQDHQTHNARFVQAKGGAELIAQGELNPEALTELVSSLLCDLDRLQKMRRAMSSLGKPQAAKNLAEGLKQISLDYQSARGAVSA